MTISQIAKKYNISESFLNSKDDAFPIIVQSVQEIQYELKQTQPNKSLSDKLDKLVDFCVDIKKSNY